MTIKDFLDFLDPDDWHLDADGNVTDSNDDCPLWHAYRVGGFDDGEAEDYVDAGKRCGLRTRDAVAIAQAADNRGHPQLRRRLLETLGLHEAPVTASDQGDST